MRAPQALCPESRGYERLMWTTQALSSATAASSVSARPAWVARAVYGAGQCSYGTTVGGHPRGVIPTAASSRSRAANTASPAVRTRLRSHPSGKKAAFDEQQIDDVVHAVVGPLILRGVGAGVELLGHLKFQSEGGYLFGADHAEMGERREGEQLGLRSGVPFVGGDLERDAETGAPTLRRGAFPRWQLVEGM